MKTNRKVKSDPVFTHEGGKAVAGLTPLQELRRSVMSCLLWEDTFYESGVSIADRIKALAEQVKPWELANLAIEARSKMNLRHAPLLLLEVLTRTGKGHHAVADAIELTIQRPDELAEFLAIYWGGKKHPLSAQTKKGLARAFLKFNAYGLAKYNRDAAVRLRDVLFLSHAKPANDDQAAVFKALAEKTLLSPDTWEVALSAGSDKKETWERLLREEKLGYLALLRNLRNMVQVDVDRSLITSALAARKGANRVLPFRYVAAARACPDMEREIDKALLVAIDELPPLAGKTIVLVDVSGSMDARLSATSDMSRVDAAAALASIINGDVTTFTFSDKLVRCPPRRGMAGVDAILGSQIHSGTYLGRAVAEIDRKYDYDRLIIVTDEQAHDDVTWGRKGRIYVINVASYQHGVGYGNGILHLDGFSENVIKFIVESEAA